MIREHGAEKKPDGAKKHKQTTINTLFFLDEDNVRLIKMVKNKIQFIINLNYQDNSVF